MDITQLPSLLFTFAGIALMIVGLAGIASLFTRKSSGTGSIIGGAGLLVTVLGVILLLV